VGSLTANESNFTRPCISIFEDYQASRTQVMIYFFLLLFLLYFKDAGVVEGCSEICGVLAEKTNSKLAGEVCTVLCTVVGIKEFIKVIQE